MSDRSYACAVCYNTQHAQGIRSLLTLTLTLKTENKGKKGQN